MNNNNAATIERNIFQEGDDFYNWVPEGSRDSDDFVPGLDSLLTYLEEKYATIALVEDTNALTITYTDDNYSNNDKTSRYELNPFWTSGASLDEQYIWSPDRVWDNVVPGLDSILRYLELKYATITSLQDAITYMNNHIQTEIGNIVIPTNPNASKITRHHYNNHEHNIIKKVDNHIHNKSNYYNFYNDTLNFKKIIMQIPMISTKNYITTQHIQIICISER